MQFFADYLKGAKARILLIVAFSDPGGSVRLVYNLFADAALEHPGCTSCKTLPKSGSLYAKHSLPKHLQPV